MTYKKERQIMEDAIYQCTSNLVKAMQNNASTDELKAEMIRCSFVLRALSSPVLDPHEEVYRLLEEAEQKLIRLKD